MRQSETFRSWADRAAIALSALCAVHCLALPLIVLVMPVLAASVFADESFHTWMVIGVVPLSVYALGAGCSRHRNYRVLALGVLGLLVLIASVLLGHDVLGEQGERAATLAGSVLIAYAHWRNYRFCQNDLTCSEQGC